jgi:hypothetical protein
MYGIPYLFACLTLFSLCSRSQSINFANGKYELGLGIGPMFFLGDLGGSAGVGKRLSKTSISR